MPEGDSLRRAELLLTPLLEGAVVESVWFRMLRGHRPRPGMRVERVDAVGKHLLIEFDHNLTLHTHLGMTGSWRTLPAGRSLRQDPRLRVIITVAGGSALCYAAPTIETFVRDGSPTPIDHLGPDLSDDDADLDEVLRRVNATASDRVVADVLLDQRIAAGIGNVFKSESLFVAQLNPFTPIGDVSDDDRRRLWTIAHRQLVANRGKPYRSTTAVGEAQRTYVYGRHRLGCNRCDNVIEYDPAGGRSPRSTYWCPSCQSAH
jgi:endonuclease VIII